MDKNNIIIEGLSIEELIEKLEYIIDKKAELLLVPREEIKIFTVEETCSILKISRPTLMEYLKSGAIKASNLGDSSRRNIRFTYEQIEAALIIIPTIKHQREF